MTSYTRTRTNYFKVKDEAAFNKLMSFACTDGDFSIIKDNTGRVGFACSSEIDFFTDDEGHLVVPDYEDDYDSDFDAFYKALQKIIADDDAAIIQEISWEGMRYVLAYATIITSKDIKTIALDTLAVSTARKMLGIENWETDTSY